MPERPYLRIAARSTARRGPLRPSFSVPSHALQEQGRRTLPGAGADSGTGGMPWGCSNYNRNLPFCRDIIITNLNYTDSGRFGGIRFSGFCGIIKANRAN